MVCILRVRGGKRTCSCRMRQRYKNMTENRIIVATIAVCRAHASAVFALVFLVATVFSLRFIGVLNN